MAIFKKQNNSFRNKHDKTKENTKQKYSFVRNLALQNINVKLISHSPQCTIQNRNVRISVLNGALWGIGQAPFGNCEIGPVL